MPFMCLEKGDCVVIRYDCEVMYSRLISDNDNNDALFIVGLKGRRGHAEGIVAVSAAEPQY